MTTRTFRQYALGIGNTTAEIIVKINGAPVYTGTVLTEDIILPPFPDYEFELDNVAYTWTGDSSHSGTDTVEISVISGSVLFANIEANNPLVDENVFGRLDTVSVDPDNVSVDTDSSSYPYVVNEQINGAPIPTSPHPHRQGQYWHLVQSGDVYTAELLTIASTASTPPTD